ncbi:MAG TPA: hypothetical protein PLO21_09495 [Mesotoga sp.]|nr:hypothetical protein [Mesotoga sp.]
MSGLNDLKLLFKYKLFIFPNKNGTRGGFSPQLMFFLIFTCMIGIFLWNVFGSIRGVEIDGTPIATVMAGFFLTVSGLFFIMSFSATTSYLFIRNSEIDMLLVLPVRRTSIAIYQIAISTVYQGLTLSVFLGIALSYHLRADSRPIVGILALLALLIDTVLLASIISVAFGRFMSRAAARKLMFVVQIISGFMFFIIVQLVPRNPDNIPVYLQKLTGAWEILANPVNLFTWSVRASGEPLFLLLSVVMIPVFGAIFYRIAGSLKFEPLSYSRSRERRVVFSEKRGSALIRRELKIYRRYEQLIYYLFYPVIFGLIFGLISEDLTTSIFTMVLISTIFTTIQSAFLMGREYPFIETTKALPLSLERIVFIKTILPVLLGILLFTGVLLISILVKNTTFLYLAVVPIVFVLYVTSSLLGIKGVLESPPDRMDNPNAFMRTKFVLLNQIICMGLSFGSIMPITMIMGGAPGSPGIWIAVLISLSSTAVAAVLSVFTRRRVLAKMKKV